MFIDIPPLRNKQNRQNVQAVQAVMLTGKKVDAASDQLRYPTANKAFQGSDLAYPLSGVTWDVKEA